MANIIQIKRSPTTIIPSSLAEGELAYSEESSTKLLYIGTNGGANIEVVGGKSIIDKVNLIAPSATANSTDAFLQSRSNHTGTQLSDTISDFDTSVSSNATVAGAIQSASKGVVNGVASLDAAGIIPTSQLPSIAITNTNVVSTQSAMLALTAQVGDVAIRSDLNKSFILASNGASTLANWQELIAPTSPLTSVNGQNGIVVLSSSDISEGTNLYYTDAQVTANTDVSANTSARHSHTNSTVLNDTTASFTTANQSKLTGISSAATANSTNAVLLARTNHTGTQLSATISDFTASTTLIIADASINGGTF